jgi:hypothetical protein
VHGVIAARVDRLEPAVKCILQEAAVIGRSFSHDILCRITDCETDLWHHLSSLEGMAGEVHAGSTSLPAALPTRLGGF